MKIVRGVQKMTEKLSLPRRLREAADVLEEVSALNGYQHLALVVWNADSLRDQAELLDTDTPPEIEKFLGPKRAL